MPEVRDLRWNCDESDLPFETTESVEPEAGVVGQDTAVDALRFGLETRAPGQNIFVRGLQGTGRLTLVRRLLDEIGPSCPLAKDRCYIHNFESPDRPKLLTMPRGTAHAFADRINELIDFIRDELANALNSESNRAKRDALLEEMNRQVEEIAKPFDEELQQNNLALLAAPNDGMPQPEIVPIFDGEPTGPLEFVQKVQKGEISQEDADALREKIGAYSKRFDEISEKIQSIRRDHKKEMRELYEREARLILGEAVRAIEKEFPGDEIREFIECIIEDVISRHPKEDERKGDYWKKYRVNVVLGHESEDSCPIIVENAPTLQNLLGVIDREFSPSGGGRSDHTMIHAGSLLRADGGFIIMEAREALSEPGAWKVLVRTLRSGRLEIVPPELSLPWMTPTLKPEPIDINVKVILLGDASLYYMLDAYDPDFPHLFKVLADFDSTIRRDENGVRRYAGVLARIAHEEELPHFHRSAVAALAEHGARIASQRDKLTARFGRVADIAREAAFIARKREHSSVVTGDDVRQAIRRSKRRADLPARRFRELVADGTIRVQTTGRAVGEVNGLAVIHAGPLVYGFPARITSTIGPGAAGVINIEREANLSGSIHTKGFYILGGLLRYLLRPDHPLAFDASIAFEQSYGGIDGDSASGAEMCCLISALTNIPIRQDLAMTGAIDQVGNILPIGAVNEKIEGFYDTCDDVGLTGEQGVIIPQANVGDLMLRHDVAAACRDGRFHVYSVATIHEALELFHGRPAGERDERGGYPEDSVLGVAVRRAEMFYQKAARPAARHDLGADEPAPRPATPPHLIDPSNPSSNED
ncbi:MAG: Lon protease family protein [Phycisphaerales bacterium]